MTHVRRFCAALILSAAALLMVGPVGLAQTGHGHGHKKKTVRPRVEVVFCLDTTGSMGGLIEGAKQKIWSLCNQIAGGQPTPDLKVGLVAYRDRGDEYVTRVYDLTDDLDAIHGHLMNFQAQGGGDEPESVNEALHVALNQVHWSEDKHVLRIIYLVGDAPPHMDYPNDIPYNVTCERAAARGIIINTIQCGNAGNTAAVWQEIAHKAEGKYVQIAQDGQVQTVSTPFDKRLAEINGALAKTAVPYGDAATRQLATAKVEAAAMPCAPMSCTATTGCTSTAPVTFGAYSGAARAMPCSAPMCLAAPALAASAADRAAYCAKTGRVSALDLVDGIKDGKVRLEDIKTEDLPEDMQKLSLAERRTYLAKVAADRAKLQAEALELDRQRSDFISQEMRKTNGQSSFDAQVMEMLREQAKKHNIAY